MTIRLLWKIPSRHLANFVEKGMGAGMARHGKTWQDMARHLLRHHYPNPLCNFLYKIATVKLGNMVHFRALLCLGVPTQCQRLQFYREPWCQRFYRDFMLKAG